MFNIINNIYLKNNSSIIPITTQELIVINKFLSIDKDNLYYLKILVKYLFYLTPLNYYYLLFFIIPKKYKVPYLNISKYKKIKDKEKKINKEYIDLQQYYDWSNKEFNYYKPLLDNML